MFIIKNRVNGEYDRRGTRSTFHKVKRGAWDKIGHAKNHIVGNLYGWSRVPEKEFDWYMDADLIELDESGVKSVIPVSEYLKKYYSDSYRGKCLNDEQRKRLGLVE